MFDSWILGRIGEEKGKEDEKKKREESGINVLNNSIYRFDIFLLLFLVFLRHLLTIYLQTKQEKRESDVLFHSFPFPSQSPRTKHSLRAPKEKGESCVCVYI